MQPLLNAPTLQFVLNRKNLIAAGLLMAGILAAFLVFRQLSQGLVAARPLSAPVSAAVLEERYGTRIGLVAVTAAGGMVDVRLKIVDAARARLLLQPAENYPRLLVSGSGAVLSISSEDRQRITLEDGGNFYLLFPNANNAVKPGAPVNLLFGDLQVEAGSAK
jgi:hypothetical protein